jgi:hypothetical protein
MHELEHTGSQRYHGDIIPYSEEEAFSLRGSNALSSREAFYERKKYKELPFFMDLPNPLYSWYESLYFGRVDPIQNGIVVNPLGPLEWGEMVNRRGISYYNHNNRNTLKQIKSDAGNVFTLNFVADAFEDLKNHLRRAGDLGVINTENTVYYKIDATRGVENYLPAFRELNRTLGFRVMNWIQSTKKGSDKTLDFKSYVSALLEYMNTRMADIPVTLTGYVVSTHSSPMISGLGIELKKDPDYSLDSLKFENYILDPNFTYFVRAARKYGFYVDRNGPWKLVADPLSPPMLQKMLKRFDSNCEHIGGYVNVADSRVFFNTYYRRTHTLDLEQLKKSLREMYNTFAETYPRVVVRTEATVACPGGAVEETLTRNPIGVLEADELGDLFWLHTYFKIRLIEAGLTYTDYDHKIRMINQMYKNYSVETTMRYINNEIKPYLYNLRVGEKPLTVEEGPVRIGSVEGVRPEPARLQGDTSMNVGHRHHYEVNSNGNGWATLAYHPDEPQIRHKHQIKNWIVQSAKSECYPTCESQYGIRGAPPHSHALLGVVDLQAPTGLSAPGLPTPQPGSVSAGTSTGGSGGNSY